VGDLRGFAPEDLAAQEGQREDETLEQYFDRIIARQSPSVEGFEGLAYAPRSRDALVTSGSIPERWFTWSTWVDGSGDWERRGGAGLEPAQKQSSYGVQAGIDGAWRNLSSPDAFLAGLMGNYVSSRVSFNGSPIKLDLDGPGLGIYTAWVHGNFSADVHGTYLSLSTREDLAGLASNAAFRANTGGVGANVQYRFVTYWFMPGIGGTQFIEPTTGFSYARTTFRGADPMLGLQDASTVRVQGGVRFGSTMFGMTNQRGIEATLTTLAYSNVVAEGSSVASGIPGSGIVPNDQGKIRGEIIPELKLNLGSGSSIFAAGDIRFGSALVGGSVSAGVRQQW